VRWVVGGVIAALVVALACIQAASDAFASSAAAPGTFPRRVPSRLGWAVYDLLDRVAPAPYVEATLAEAALDEGDAARALVHALRLPASPTRDEILGRIALARHEQQLALEYFLAAPDANAVQSAVLARAAQNPAEGYALERLLEARLALSATHPDAVAETYWHMGILANQEAWRQVSGSATQLAWLRRGLGDFESAVRISPLSERYVIAAANQEDLHACLKRMFPFTAGTMHTRVSQNWDLATAMKYLEKDLGYKGLYTIEANGGHAGTKQIYDVVVATLTSLNA